MIPTTCLLREGSNERKVVLLDWSGLGESVLIADSDGLVTTKRLDKCELRVSGTPPTKLLDTIPDGLNEE